jgi:Ran GTPase-activating protein (RanGAP) involved in mRNA processing and transport
MSVRNISIKKTNGDDQATREEEDLVCALIEHYPLQKLSFGDYLNRHWYSGALIGENVSSCIKSMLEDPKCKLESLSLYHIGEDMDMNLLPIASGLAKNTSVKTIAHTVGTRPHFLLDINTENHTLEVLNLPMYSSLRTQPEDLAVALNGFRALKSLDLSRHRTKPGVLSAIFKAELMPPSRLEDLILCRIDGGMNDESLSVLGECIAANKTLKRLDLSDNGWGSNITTAGWASFFRQLRQTASLKLESIDLQINRSIDDSILQELMDLFRSATNLKTVKLGGCGISSNGANRLLDMLHQTPIQNIDDFCVDTENNLPANFYTMLRNGSLRGLNFSWLNLATSLHLINSIQHPNCNLEKFESAQEIHTPVEFAQIIFGWAGVLKRYATIKSLCLQCEFNTIHSLVDFWHEYSNLLCNRETIEATYSSNHYLESLDYSFCYDLEGYDSNEEDDDIADETERRLEEACKTPLEIRLLLDLNKDSDKAAVARRKIIQVHFSGASKVQNLHGLNIDPKVVPNLLSWVGKQNSELSLMYEYLQSVPALIEDAAVSVSAGRKRNYMHTLA